VLALETVVQGWHGVACGIGFMGGDVKVMAGLDEVLLCLV